MIQIIIKTGKNVTTHERVGVANMCVSVAVCKPARSSGAAARGAVASLRLFRAHEPLTACVHAHHTQEQSIGRGSPRASLCVSCSLIISRHDNFRASLLSVTALARVPSVALPRRLQPARRPLFARVDIRKLTQPRTALRRCDFSLSVGRAHPCARFSLAPSPQRGGQRSLPTLPPLAGARAFPRCARRSARPHEPRAHA
jgi:hypothetical protein